MMVSEHLLQNVKAQINNFMILQSSLQPFSKTLHLSINN